MLVRGNGEMEILLFLVYRWGPAVWKVILWCSWSQCQNPFVSPSWPGHNPSLWLIHPLFGHRFIYHSEPSPCLILEGLEIPHSSVSALCLMKFWGAHTKEQGVVILIVQLWKPCKAKWCTRGHTPVSEAKVGSPCPQFLPSLSHKPREQ